MVEPLTLIYSLAAALIAAAVTYFVIRSQCRVQIDFLRTSLAEREAQLAAVKSEGDELRTAAEADRTSLAHKLEQVESELRAAISDKSRLQGEASSFDQVRQELANRVREVAEQTERILALSDQLARAQAEAAEAHRAKVELVEAKERECRALLAEKEVHIEEQKRLLAAAETKLAETFDSLSVKALTVVSEQFMKTAKATFEALQTDAKGDLKLKQQAIEELLKPVAQSISKLQEQHEDLEKRRISAFDTIEKGFAAITRQTDQLANALRKPISRGAWGEMNLKTILDNAGLTQGVHYDLQDTTDADEGGRLRTDVIVHLPNGRDFIIDSKAPLEAYWDGMNCELEADRKLKFDAHGRQVREHIKRLASKAYWSRYKTAPDCVVMFLPTEGAYQAAIEADPALLTDAQSKGIYLANPMTLVNMIHVTAYVLQEESLKQNAHEVQSAATELYDRLSKFVVRFADLGRSMRISVAKFNDAAGSLEGRVLPQARKMSALGIGGSKGIDSVNEIDSVPRTISSPELRAQRALAVIEEDKS